jgi:hypothetical protein
MSQYVFLVPMYQYSLPCILEIREGATFKEVADSFDTRGHIYFLLERIEDNGLLYWTVPAQSHPIPATQRDWWVISSSTDYVLALVRGMEEDRPIIIGKKIYIHKEALLSITNL